MIPAFADPATATRPLYLVPSDAVEVTLADLPSAARAWLLACDFKGTAGDLRVLPDAEGGIVGAVLGMGTSQARARGRFPLAKAATGLPSGAWHLENLAPQDAVDAALGWLLAQYRFDRYRPKETALTPALLRCPAGCDPAQILAMAAGEFLTRDLINTPASDMGPAELEAAFHALAARHGAASQAIIGADLLAENFPMVHAVGHGSDRAPRILSMTWGGKGPRLTLVGKGVCFDTGGLNIKPSAGMLLMKKDMGGAATVMGLAQMIMQLNLPLQLRVIVPAVENAISGRAMRPKDILTSRKGLTVEVNDTDAEGRLVLADALAWACEENPDMVISMATLTGAARVAVGPDLAPYYTDDEAMSDALQQGARLGVDPVWRLPFHTPYEHIIEPGIADLDNAPGWGFAGSITAALFLRRFVEGPRYMHFDIYGHSPADLPARPKGGVGQGARALLNALPQMLNL